MLITIYLIKNTASINLFRRKPINKYIKCTGHNYFLPASKDTKILDISDNSLSSIANFDTTAKNTSLI